MVSRFKLDDWNDARILLACIDQRGFSGAALALGIDQSTVSRRMAALESAVARPLFLRRRGGAIPTPVGKVLAERARGLVEEIQGFERAVIGLAGSAVPKVRVGALDGVTTYLITPGLLGLGFGPFSGRKRKEVPSLSFVPIDSPDADITVQVVSPGQAPSGLNSAKIRRVGRMTFVPVTTKKYVERRGMPARFADLVSHTMLDLSQYRRHRSLEPWHGLMADKRHGPEYVFSTTPALHRALAGHTGIALLPNYSDLCDPSLLVLHEIAESAMSCNVWLSAHEDALREPAVRIVFNDLAELFTSCRWFS